MNKINERMIHWLTDLLTHWPIHSLMNLFMNSYMNSLNPELTFKIVHELIYLFTYSLNYPPTHLITRPVNSLTRKSVVMNAQNKQLDIERCLQHEVYK